MIGKYVLDLWIVKYLYILEALSHPSMEITGQPLNRLEMILYQPFGGLQGIMLIDDRGFLKDEEGVSEVVGTILTLAITVVLFTSVYAGVTTLEAPEQRDHVDITADFERVGGTNYINATHRGGKQLQFDSLAFTVLVDGKTHQASLEDDSDDSDLKLNKSGDTWTVGQEVTIRDDDGIMVGSTIELVIQNRETNRVVYSSVLAEKGPQLLQIKNTYIRYNEDWKNYVEKGNEIGIIAEINGLNEEDVWVNATILHDSKIVTSGNEIRLENKSGNRGNRYSNESLEISPTADEGSYSVKVTLENKTESKDTAYVKLNVGIKPAIDNPKRLEIGQIDYTPQSPSHGDTLTLEVPVYNHWSGTYETDWKVIDDYKGRTEEKDNDTNVKFTAGPAPTVIRPSFQINGSGPHQINIDIATSEEWTGGSKGINVHVDPHALVVEDITAKETDEAEVMSNTLSGLNVDHDVTTVSDDGNLPYEEYSVVIWMIGDDESKDPVLEDAAGELETYLDKDNGSLWIKGAYDLPGLNLGSLSDKLGYDSDSDSFSSKTGDKTLNSDEGGAYEYYKGGIDISGPSYSMDPKSDANDTLRHSEDGEYDPNGETFGVGYNQTNGTQRTAVDSFMIDSIDDPGVRSNLVIDVIEWLTNITRRERRDVAVIEQYIEPDAPMFRDQIEITATIRNNGPDRVDLTNTIRLIRNGGEEIIPLPEDAGDVKIDGGNTTKVSFTWEAVDLGIQRFIIDADYLGQLDETNTVNNDIRYKNLDVTDDEIEVNVHYSTLVVDADLSETDGSTNTTAEVVESLERLEYDKGADYNVTYLSDPAGDDPESVDNSTLSDYNSVFWITGSRSDSALSEGDEKNITAYMESGGNIMLMGSHIADSLEPDDDLTGYLGIDSFNGKKEAELLNGQRNNNVSHNLKYEIENSKYDSVETTDEGEVLFENMTRGKFGSTKDNRTTKAVYMPVNLENITGPQAKNEDFGYWDVNTSEKNARAEFIYTVLWSFGKKEVIPSQQNPELRVTDYDIRISTEQPRTANSYIINATIENIGYEGSTALVRFKEGNDHIGSRTPYIGPSERFTETGSTYSTVNPGSITVEMQWNPINPGERPLKVRVDPIDSVEEITNETTGEEIMEFNNQAIIEQPVYYFYDDMEDDSENWEHNRNLMNIDGESPLDFVDRKDINTNVVGEWDSSYSGSTLDDAFYPNKNGVYETDNESVTSYTHSASYSNPRSFWMPETEALNKTGRDPIDVVMLIDTSGSMSGEPIADAKEAAENFVLNLTEKDRLSLWRFEYAYSYNDPVQVMDFTKMDEAGRDEAINGTSTHEGIRDFYADGKTPLWDSIHTQIDDAYNNVRTGDVFPFVMSLTDGEDTSSDVMPEDNWPQPPWPPYDDDGNPDDDWQAPPSNLGVCEAPITSYTVGLSIPGGEDGDLADMLKETAQSSNPSGKFYYAPESGDLNEIFESIYENVTEEAGGIKSVDPTDTDSSDTIEEEKGNELEAQSMATELLSEGFEGGSLPTDWATENGDWEIIEESYSNLENPYGGNYMAGIEYHYDDDNEWLITKEIDASSASNLQLTFYDSYEWPSDGSTNSVKVSTQNNNPNTFDTVKTYDSTYINNRDENSWKKQTVDLSGYDGENKLYIAWQYTGYDAENWFIDDVTVSWSTNDPPAAPTNPSPYDGATGVSTSPTLSVDVSDPDGDTMDVTFYDGSGNSIGTDTGVASGGTASVSWSGLSTDTNYYWYTVADDGQATTQSSTWQFTTSSDGEGGGGDTYDIDRKNYRFTTTNPANIGDSNNINDMTLSFRTKHWMTQGTNGGVLYLWGKNESESGWNWDQDHRVYMKPEQSYTGNLKFSGVDNNASEGGPLDTGDGYTGLRDAKGDLPYWCFNGKSQSGTFGWRYVEVDVEDYLDDFNMGGDGAPDEIRVMFLYARFGGINKDEGWHPEMGWYIDNVQLKISADWSSDGPGYWAKTNTSDLQNKGLDSDEDDVDMTDYEDEDGHEQFWMFGNISEGEDHLPEGVDASLYTPLISLSNAENPVLNADVKFNFNNASGLPPNGLRIEISDDNGVTWSSVTYGVRSGWGASGDSENGGYSGSTGDSSDYGWVDTDTLARLNVDLSGWRGENIIIRFRVFTNNDDEPIYEDESLPEAVFIDDVIVRENTTNNNLNGLSENSDSTQNVDEGVEKGNDDSVENGKGQSRSGRDEGDLQFIDSQIDTFSRYEVESTTKEIKKADEKSFVPLERRRKIWF